MPAIKLLFATCTPFIDNCTNLFGQLKPDIRKRLLAVLNRPNQKNWDNAYSIIIEGRRMTTLWQAVLAVDPTFTRSKPWDEPWPLIPDQFTLCRAIRQATHPARTDEWREQTA